MEDKDSLMISGIQHYVYCPRQWALIHLEDQWAENGLTAEGRVLHERVHDRSVRDYRNGVVTIRGVRVNSRAYGLTGECDAVELIPDEEGINFSKVDGTWRIQPVEYKHGESKPDDCDRLQLAAQAVSLEEMLCCTIEKGVLFYKKTRRREVIAIDEELRNELKNIVEEMQKLYQRGYTPRVKGGKKCNQCSLHDICMPELMRKSGRGDVRAYIRNHLEED